MKVLLKLGHQLSVLFHLTLKIVGLWLYFHFVFRFINYHKMAQDPVDKYTRWIEADPITLPILGVDAMPKHTPDRFAEYVEILDETDKLIGFKLTDGTHFRFDSYGG
jgi:hypothetical protein